MTATEEIQKKERAAMVKLEGGGNCPHLAFVQKALELGHPMLNIIQALQEQGLHKGEKEKSVAARYRRRIQKLTPSTD